MNKIRNRRELAIKIYGVYKWISRNNPKLLDLLLPNSMTYWDYKSCKKEAAKYKSRKEYETFSNSSYQYARRKGILDSICAHMVHRSQIVTAEECINESRKYGSRYEWARKSPRTYRAATRHGLFNECVKHMKRSIK